MYANWGRVRMCVDGNKRQMALKSLNSALLAVYYALRQVCGKLITTATQLWLPVALILIKWV